MPSETPAQEKEEEPAVTVAEGLEVEKVLETAAAEEAEEEREEEKEKAELPESLPVETPAPEEEEEAAVAVVEDLEAERVVETAAAEEAEEVKEAEEEEVGPPESLPLKTPAPEKEEEATARVIEGHGGEGRKGKCSEIILISNYRNHDC